MLVVIAGSSTTHSSRSAPGRNERNVTTPNLTPGELPLLTGWQEISAGGQPHRHLVHDLGDIDAVIARGRKAL